jgi:molybdenum cofactor synthesis domain-containing protein
MVRIGILTTSDKGAAGARDDTSGDTIARMASGAGHTIAQRAIVPDEREVIAQMLSHWCDNALCEVIMTTGGTGLTTRDVTPDATRDVAEREVPGISTALAVSGLAHTPFAALTRGIAVTRGKTLIVNLPGSPKGTAEGMEVLLPLLEHVAALLAGPVEHDETGSN